MGGAFADRWGVPVQGADEEGIAALDGAVECLLALAGDRPPRPRQRWTSMMT
jgi:hypothetical protein